MQMKKKSVLTFVVGCSLIASLALPISSTSVFAGEISRTNPVGFKSGPWERYASGDSGCANLTYGFNTFMVDEDYAYARHSTKYHRSKITNANGTHQGGWVANGRTSVCEVMHSGSSVTYKTVW